MQLDLPLARRLDQPTSHAAAAEAASLSVRHRLLILGSLRVDGPAGKDALARRTNLSGVQVCRRLPELEHQGLIEPTGQTVTSDAGRQEREWRSA
ncbi:MAG: hypothetical protein RLZZ373_2633 [Pseudomonadota bacterium]|jgi:predicted ArsR family transcriptional regulator